MPKTKRTWRRRPPPRGGRTVCVVLDEELAARVDEAAAAMDLTRSQIIRAALRLWLEAHRPAKAE